jgi:hypothetical protein
MSPKTINITYWVSTLLFAALMIFSSIGGIQPSKDAIELMHDGLGYPVYFIQFISIAKLLGAVVILVPAAKKIKEWAYAGLFFDLAGAVYSGVAASGKFDPMMLMMLGWIVPGIVSYYYWNKRTQACGQQGTCTSGCRLVTTLIF